MEIESRWCEFETKAVKTKAAVYFVSLVLPWRLISIMKLIMAASCAKRRGGDRSGNWRRRGDVVSFQTDFSASSSCKLVGALCKASIVLEMEG